MTKAAHLNLHQFDLVLVTSASNVTNTDFVLTNAIGHIDRICAANTLRLQLASNLSLAL